MTALQMSLLVRVGCRTADAKAAIVSTMTCISRGCEERPRVVLAAARPLRAGLDIASAGSSGSSGVGTALYSLLEGGVTGSPAFMSPWCHAHALSTPGTMACVNPSVPAPPPPLLDWELPEGRQAWTRCCVPSPSPGQAQVAACTVSKGWTGMRGSL